MGGNLSIGPSLLDTQQKLHHAIQEIDRLREALYWVDPDNPELRKSRSREGKWR